MITKHIKLSPEVLDVLRRSTITETTLELPGQLDRKLYVATMNAITAAGGKWNRKAGVHIFESDPRAALGMAIESGKMIDEKKTLQAFDTPDDLADRLVDLANIEIGNHILEPSAGTGQIVQAIRRRFADSVHIMAVEIDPKRAKMLKLLGEPYDVYEGDFILNPFPMHYFDRVIMNPPFNGRQAIKHVLHAHSFLRPPGRLVAIVPNGPAERVALQPMAKDWIDLPAGAFKASGTNVNTAICIL